LSRRVITSPASSLQENRERSLEPVLGCPRGREVAAAKVVRQDVDLRLVTCSPICFLALVHRLQRGLALSRDLGRTRGDLLMLGVALVPLALALGQK
jgi:hypothetical protein